MRRSPLARIGPSLVHTGPQFSRQYYHRVLRYNPVAFWPGWEASGTNAVCLVGTGMDGTWARDVATMGTAAGIGDGNTAPTYDGTNDYYNALSAVLTARFNGVAGSILQWVQVDSAAWTDGTQRWFLSWLVDANNYVNMTKGAANNQLLWSSSAGGVFKQVAKSSVSETRYMFLGVTWDKNAGVNGEMKAYYYVNGSGGQEGATQTGLGTWAGALAVAIVGAPNLTPTNTHDGQTAHVAVFDRALTVNAFNDLAVVE